MASAQVKSCVLIAGMLAAGSTTVSERAVSRDHTERMLRRARVPFERDGLRITVAQVDELELDEVVVPGDPSSAAFIVAAAILVGGSRVVVKDVGLNWTRTGFFRIAERMGAVIVGELEEPGTESDEEPVGELDVASGPLEGTVVEPDEVPLAIDELTLVALLGAHAEGETVVRGAEELRLKESDRIAGVVEGLRGLGADIEATPDGFVVRGDGSPLRGGTIDANGDHRMAMLGAVAGPRVRSRAWRWWGWTPPRCPIPASSTTSGRSCSLPAACVRHGCSSSTCSRPSCCAVTVVSYTRGGARRAGHRAHAVRGRPLLGRGRARHARARHLARAPPRRVRLLRRLDPRRDRAVVRGDGLGQTIAEAARGRTRPPTSR